MELEELEARLLPFARAQYDDPEVQVYGVHKMPGHAGFSYGFSVRSAGVEAGAKVAPGSRKSTFFFVQRSCQ